MEIRYCIERMINTMFATISANIPLVVGQRGPIDILVFLPSEMQHHSQYIESPQIGSMM